MKLFKCQSCQQLLFFENIQCLRCGHRLGYLPDRLTVTALEPADPPAVSAGDAPAESPADVLWQPLARPERRVRLCANARYDACNWLLDEGEAGSLCAACRHNRTIPDLSVPEHLERWRKLETAKHRLLYTLLRLRLPLATSAEDPQHGLAFDFLADPPQPTAPKVMTGHDCGLITIALAEADDAERERRRSQMGEPYRSLLGHFRHEVGHHYWDVLIRDGGRLDECRALFGDERSDYGAALQAHYTNGAPADWQSHFVSAYATSHPWEDWAESFAHYLHIVDTLEMARAFGISVDPRVTDDESLSAEITLDPYRAADVQTLVEAWLPLTFAVNALNRAMGTGDLYPFVLSPPAVEKLGFVHRVVQRR